MNSDDATLAEIEAVDYAINSIVSHTLPAMNSEIHNLRIHLIETLGVRHDSDELVRSVATGLSLAYLAIAEGRDPMITKPVLISAEPRAALREILTQSEPPEGTTE